MPCTSAALLKPFATGCCALTIAATHTNVMIQEIRTMFSPLYRIQKFKKGQTMLSAMNYTIREDLLRACAACRLGEAMKVPSDVHIRLEEDESAFICTVRYLGVGQPVRGKASAFEGAFTPVTISP